MVGLTITRPDGDDMKREVLVSPPAATVLPYDVMRRTVILVCQFRAAVLEAGAQPELLEAIAGIVDPGETPEASIRREAMEEAGLRLNALESLGAAWASPGYSTERIHLFLAPYSLADRSGRGGGLAEEQEHIDIREIAVADLKEMLERNALSDLKTLALAQALALRHPEIFRQGGAAPLDPSIG